MQSDEAICMSNQTSPHRFRYSQFKRYEPILVRVWERYPRATKFVPTEFSLETVTNRFRDICTAYIKNPDWSPLTEVPHEWMLKWWPTMCVTHDGTRVIVKLKGEKDAPVVEAEFQDDQPQQVATTRLILDSPHLDNIEACCVLIRDQVITEPVQIRNLGPELLQRVETLIKNTYSNIELHPQGNNEYLLL